MSQIEHNPTYRPTCPWCGNDLQPLVLGPESAPWLCFECHQSFWVIELAEEFRQHYRASMRDRGVGPHLQDLEEKMLAEREEARARGSSCRIDQLQLLASEAIQHLARQKRLDPDFMVMVKLELERKTAC